MVIFLDYSRRVGYSNCKFVQLVWRGILRDFVVFVVLRKFTEVTQINFLFLRLLNNFQGVTLSLNEETEMTIYHLIIYLGLQDKGIVNFLDYSRQVSQSNCKFVQIVCCGILHDFAVIFLLLKFSKVTSIYFFCFSGCLQQAWHKVDEKSLQGCVLETYLTNCAGVSSLIVGS